MPIRINLLAEQQAAEELRRRDPVKRAIWVGGFVAAVMVIWSAQLQFKLMAALREVNRYESEWKKLESEYSKVTANLAKAGDAERKWAALQSLASNRFLWASPLNALQYVMTKVDDVRILRLRSEQTYTLTEGTKPSTNAAGAFVPGRPGTSRERILLTFDARDSSRHPGDQIAKFQEAINNNPYFKTNLQKTELTGRSPEQADTSNPGRAFVTFTLECQYPEKVR